MDNHDFYKILLREKFEKKILYEGLIYSYPAKMIIRKLVYMGYDDIAYNGKTINIVFNLSNQNKQNYDELNNLMNNVYDNRK